MTFKLMVMIVMLKVITMMLTMVIMTMIMTMMMMMMVIWRRIKAKNLSPATAAVARAHDEEHQPWFSIRLIRPGHS